MEAADLEGLAEWAYRAAHLPDDQPASGLELTQRLLGGHVLRVHGETSGRLVQNAEGFDIHIRPGWSPTQARWLVAHELAEWILARDGYRETDTETVADALAARLIAPHRAIRRALGCGLDVAELAEVFGATQSCLLLRQAEVSGEPTALVTPARIYVRGSEWAWPNESGVRLLVTEEPRPGLAKVRITDARRRVGLVAG